MCSSAIFVSRFLLVSANLLSALLSLLVVEMPSTHRAQHVPILDLDASDEELGSTITSTPASTTISTTTAQHVPETLASAPLGGLVALGVSMGIPGFEATFLQTAWGEVEGFKLMPIPPKVVPAAAEPDPFAAECFDFPIEGVRATTVAHVFDILTDYAGPVDVEAVTKALKKKDYAALPPPFKPKDKYPGFPYTMDVVIDKQENGRYNIFKWIYFEDAPPSSRVVPYLVYGEPHHLCRTKAAYRIKKTVHYLMTKMNGLKVFNQGWQHEKTTTKTRGQSMTEDQRAAGYKFIREKGPRSNNSNQFMEWTDKWVHREGSPILDWPEGKIKEALRNYQLGRTNAKTLTKWVLTLKDFEGWFLRDVLMGMLGSLRQHGILWLGKSRVGKSCGSKTVAFAMSLFEILAEGDAADGDEVASIVTAKYFDFLKGEPVTKKKPAVLDDALVQTLTADLLKAFLYPGEEDATIWARYNSATMDQGASRQACGNPFDRVAVASVVGRVPLQSASHAEFLQIVAPAFAKVDDSEDLLAVLARTHMIVCVDH